MALQAILIAVCLGVAKAGCPFAPAPEKSLCIHNKILAASFWAKTDEAQAGARYTAGLAVVAVGGLFAVFATISRKGRRGLDAGAKGYGATDSSVDALLA